MSWAWVWFILLCLVTVGRISTHYRVQKANRIEQASSHSYRALVIEEGMDPRDAAYRYLENLDSTLMSNDYDEFMALLCRMNGVEFRKDTNDSAGMLTIDSRRKLANKLAGSFVESDRRVKTGRL